MSMLLMVKAMNIKVGNPTTKLVLLKLADNANDQGFCWPSYQNIADHSEVDRRTAMRHIQKLSDLGLVQIHWRKDEQKGNKSNYYQLTLDAPPSDNLTLPPSDTRSPGSDPVTLPPGDHLSPRTSHSFEPVKEPIKTKTTTRASAEEFFDFKFFKGYASGAAIVEKPPQWAADIFRKYEPGMVDPEFKSALIKQFGGFIVFNLSHGHGEIELERAQALFVRWLDNRKQKPVKHAQSAAESQIKALSPCDHAEIHQFEAEILTPGEKLLLKRGQIPNFLRDRLGDEKFNEILVKYGIDKQ